MIILTTKGSIFGGFTPIAWDSSNTFKPDSTQTSFLFTLKNHHTSEAKKFLLKSSSNAIHCDSSNGPVFGSNCDMAVRDRCSESTSNCTYPGGAYVNDTGIDGKHVFTGEFTFTVKEIEVFSISLEINLFSFTIFARMSDFRTGRAREDEMRTNADQRVAF
jgi:hypothetical protein